MNLLTVVRICLKRFLGSLFVADEGRMGVLSGCHWRAMEF